VILALCLAAAGCGHRSVVRRPGGGADGGVPVCPDGFVVCDGTCLDPASSVAHCGATAGCQGAAAGRACQPGEICAAGVCVLSCTAGFLICDGVCTDPMTSPRHCGATGDCAGARAGGCDDGAACRDGACVASCAAPMTACPDGCFDTRIDPGHCGGCGQACDSGQACLDGLCSTAAAACSVPVLIAGATTSATGAVEYPTSVALAARGATARVIYSTQARIAASRYDAPSRSWSQPADVRSASSSQLQIAVDGRGAAVACWAEGAQSGWCAFSGGTGAWGAQASLGAGLVKLVMAADGSAAVLVDDRATLGARRLLPGSTAWLPTDTIAPHPGRSIGQTDLAVAAGGRAVAAWSLFSDPSPVMRSGFSPATGGWSAAQAAGGAGSFYPVLSMNARGDTTMIWHVTDPDGGASQDVWADRLDGFTGAWMGPQLLTTVAARQALLATDDAGDGLVVFPTHDPSSSVFAISARLFPAGGQAWQSVPFQAAEMPASIGPLLSAAPGGAALLTVQASSGVAVPRFARWDPARAAWAPSQIFRNQWQPDYGAAALLDDGTMVVAWLASETAIAGSTALWVVTCGP
jgi:hypothetical protein